MIVKGIVSMHDELSDFFLRLHFTTSFAYMPSEQYYDLPHDAENQRQREIKQQEKDWKKERDNKDTPNIPIDYQIQVYNNDL